MMTNSSDTTFRQGGIGSVLQGFLGGVVNILTDLFGLSSDAITGMLVNLLASFNKAISNPASQASNQGVSPDLGIDLFHNMSFGDSIQAMLPLTSRQSGDFHQLTFGVINNDNRLIVTNIVSKSVGDNTTTIGDKREVLNQLSLNGLHSMMTSLVNQMTNDTDPMYLAALQVSYVMILNKINLVIFLKCQLDGLGCSLRQREYFQVQICLQSVTSVSIFY